MLDYGTNLKQNAFEFVLLDQVFLYTHAHLLSHCNKTVLISELGIFRVMKALDNNFSITVPINGDLK